MEQKLIEANLLIVIIKSDIRFGATIVRTTLTTLPGANPNLDL